MAPQTLPVLRRSAIESASQCLFRFKATWIDDVDDTNDYALRGTAFHACANRYIQRLVDKQIGQDEEEAQLAFTEGIAAARPPARLIPEIRFIFDLWAERFELALDQFLVAEERQENEDRMFTPDLVYARQSELEIIDFKTFFVPLTEAQAKEDMQARWYIAAAKRKWPGFQTYRFTFDFVRLNKFVSVVFTPAELDRLDREVEAVVAMIARARDENHWPATPGPACGYCTLKCPVVDQDLVVEQRLPTYEQAVRVAGWIMAGERMLSTAKKALKQFASVHGPINVKGVVWDNRPIISRSYPIDVLVKELAAANALGAFSEAGELGLTVSHSALAKVFKRFPLLLERLETSVIEKQTWRFSSRKAGEDEGEE